MTILAPLKWRFTRFAAVGTLGFLVDTAVLYTLLGVGAGLYSGRAGSFLMAVTFTWAMNRILTFRDTDPRLIRQWGTFAIVNSLGGAVNYGVYAALVAAIGFVAAWPVLGVAAGSLAGMVINFLLSRHLVFNRGRAS